MSDVVQMDEEETAQLPQQVQPVVRPPPPMWKPNNTGFTYQAPQKRSIYQPVSTTDLNEPDILTRTRGGANIRYVSGIRDKTLRGIEMNSAEAQSSIALLGDKSYSNYLVEEIKKSGLDVRVNQVGLIYLSNGIPIDSKRAKRELHNTPGYKKPETMQQYRAKAAIRFAQIYNKMIRSLHQNQKMDNGALELMWQNVNIARQKRETMGPTVRAARAIRQIMKKYDAKSLTEALAKRDAKIKDFQAKQLQDIRNKTNYLTSFLKKQ